MKFQQIIDLLERNAFSRENGTYCARLVALGYSQIPGVDFETNYLPIINDVTFRILLVMILVKWYIEVVDIQIAFLLQQQC